MLNQKKSQTKKKHKKKTKQKRKTETRKPSMEWKVEGGGKDGKPTFPVEP